MGDILGWVQQALLFVMQPARWAMEVAGLQPTDIQVWVLIVGILIIAAMAPVTYGDVVLRRRQARTVGTVVSLDESDDGATPRIGFRDHSGRPIEFASPMPVNGNTRTVGGAVDVIYDPLHPQRAREAGRVLGRLFSAVVWYGIAVALIAYAVIG